MVDYYYDDCGSMENYVLARGSLSGSTQSEQYILSLRAYFGVCCCFLFCLFGVVFNMREHKMCEYASACM